MVVGVNQSRYHHATAAVKDPVGLDIHQAAYVGNTVFADEDILTLTRFFPDSDKYRQTVF